MPIRFSKHESAPKYGSCKNINQQVLYMVPIHTILLLNTVVQRAVCAEEEIGVFVQQIELRMSIRVIVIAMCRKNLMFLVSYSEFFDTLFQELSNLY